MATVMVAVLGSFTCASATERAVAAGATATTNGWRASLFVTRPPAHDPALALGGSTTVGARISRPLGKGMRISFDVFNVFDAERRALDPLAISRSGADPAIAENYLFHPAESRGVRVGISVRF